MTDVQTIHFSRGNLPHWLVADRTYFVTIRLKGTLPEDAIEELQHEREQLLQCHADDGEALNRLRKRQFLRIEAILDACQTGNRWLEVPQIAKLALENMNWLDTSRGWQIYAAVVMPTHLHILLRSREGRNGELTADLGQYKNFTARQANRHLKRSGAFWMRENFDHWLRGPLKMAAATEYIHNNPVKAGLVNFPDQWPWRR